MKPLRVAMFFAGGGLLIGCNGVGDTGPGPKVEPGVLDPLPDGYAVDGDGECEANSGGVVAVGEHVRDFEIDGLTGSTNPGASYTVRAKRLSGTCAPAKTSWCNVTTTGLESGEAWTSSPSCSAEQSDAGWRSFTNCTGTGYASGEDPCGAANLNSCDGEYAVQAKKGANNCFAYSPMRIQLEIADPLGPQVSPDSSCTAGSGRFWLYPRALTDRDGDGHYSVFYLPVQRTGTGRMTRHAWVTNVTLVEDEGYDLRVVKDNNTFWFTKTDAFDDTSKTTLITGSHSFSTGVIRGLPDFGVAEIDPSEGMSMQVDMTWSCGASTSSLGDLAKGYVISLDAIGCDPIQDLVLRFYSSPDRVEIERYGDPTHRIVVPTTNVAAGEKFEFGWNKAHVQGVLESHDNTSATIDIQDLTWDGDTVCDPDEYVFSAE